MTGGLRSDPILPCQRHNDNNERKYKWDSAKCKSCLTKAEQEPPSTALQLHHTCEVLPAKTNKTCNLLLSNILMKV